MYKFFKYLRKYDDAVRVVKEIFNVLKKYSKSKQQTEK